MAWRSPQVVWLIAGVGLLTLLYGVVLRRPIGRFTVRFPTHALRAAVLDADRWCASPSPPGIPSR